MASQNGLLVEKPVTLHRRNLCLFTNRFGHGGTEHQFSEVVSRLDQRKYNITVACFSRTGEFLELVTRAGLPVVEFARSRWFSPGTARCAWEWISLLRRERIELVHTFDIYTNMFAGPLARLAGVPYLLTSRRDTGSMHSSRRIWASRRVYFRSDRVVANSDAARESLLAEKVPERLIRVVRNGVDLKLFCPNGNRLKARHKRGWKDDELLIGVIGNLRPEKGHDILLQSVPEVVKQCPQARFLIVGPGPLLPVVRNHVETSGLGAHVSILGDSSEIPELLAALDIVALPSTSESLPNVVLEAMSAGRPVVASAVGGCLELIEHGRTGLLFTPRDAHGLADQILRLAVNPQLRAEIGHAARKHAESEFDINLAAKRLEAIYDEVLERQKD